MFINFKLRVSSNFDSLLHKWDIQLFKAMTPFPLRIDIIKFDGSRKGNAYDICVILFGKSMRWKGIIGNSRVTKNYSVFIDSAFQLPYPLKSWCHKHWLIKNSESEVLLIDKIHYRCNNRLWEVLIYIPVMIAFYQRLFLAKRYLESKSIS